jgi:hypothetical protein
MAAFKITEAVLTKRRMHVAEVLARRPDITKNHFKKAFGYDPEWLTGLEAEGVVFGKPVRRDLVLKRRAA